MADQFLHLYRDADSDELQAGSGQWIVEVVEIRAGAEIRASYDPERRGWPIEQAPDWEEIFFVDR